MLKYMMLQVVAYFEAYLIVQQITALFNSKSILLKKININEYIRRQVTLENKHIFVVNPIAGKGKQALLVAEQIEKYRDRYDIETYFTKRKGDAADYIRSRLENGSPDVFYRFYICGGDGSLNEAVNGAMRSGKDNYALCVYPAGSGNDFVKALGGAERYSDIGKLLNGEIRDIDVIKAGTYYAINAVHFGFDSCVARVMNNVRDKKLIGGRNSYTTGVAVAFLTAMRSECTLIADGEVLNYGDFLLCTIANGQYVGGKYKCAPYSLCDDGLLDICMVKPVSRFRFLKLMGYYERGEHIDSELFKDIIVYRKAKRLELSSGAGFCYSLDGELVNESSVQIEVLPKVLKFVFPNCE